MAIIFEDALKRDIASGSFAPAYILFGDDSYLKKLYCDKICEKAVDGDPFFNLQIFNGLCELQPIFDAVGQYPLMSSRKCVVLNDYDIDHASKSELDALISLFSNLNDTCVLVLRFDGVEFDPNSRKNSKAKNIVAALEKNGGKAVNLNHRKPSELIKTLVSGAQKRGCKMENDAAVLLLDTVGSDLNNLSRELEKLCFYKKDGVIDKAAVELLCAKSVEASVFDLMDYVFGCDITKALSLLDDLFYTRVEPMIILYTVSGAFVDLYRVFAAKKAGVPISQIAADFGYGKRAFLLERQTARLKKFDEKRLRLCFEELLLADHRLKSFSADERIVLEELVVKLCYIISKGEAVC